MKIDHKKTFLLLLILFVSNTYAQQVMLKKGTTIPVRIAQNVNGNIDSQGDTIFFEVMDDVLVDGKIAVKKGTFANGKITNAEGRKSLGKAGKIALEIRSVKSVDDQIINIVRDKLGSEGRKRTGATVAHVIMWGPLGLFAKGRAARVMIDTEYDIEVESDLSINTAANGGNSSNSPDVENLDVHFKKYNSKINYAKGKIGKDFKLNIVLPKTTNIARNDIKVVEILGHKLPKPIVPTEVSWNKKTKTFIAVLPFREVVKYSAPGTVNVLVNVQVDDKSVLQGQTTLTTKWKMK